MKMSLLIGQIEEAAGEGKWEHEQDVKVKTVFGNVLIKYQAEKGSNFHIIDPRQAKPSGKTGYYAVVENGKYNGWNGWDTTRKLALVKVMQDIARDYAYQLVD